MISFILGLAELPEGAFCAADIDSNGVANVSVSAKSVTWRAAPPVHSSQHLLAHYGSAQDIVEIADLIVG